MSRPAPSLARAVDALGRVGLADQAFRLWQRVAAFGAPADPALPPPYLRVLTAGSADAEAFTSLGRAAAAEVLALAERHGAPPGPEDAVLDFGCGCGRVARPFGEVSAAQLHGCDVNGRLTGWCAEHLPGRFRKTAAEPPLPYADRSFALIYAHSVFTHLRRANARRWLRELARVTRPGGLACLSLFDEDMPAAEPFRVALIEDGYLVRRAGREGSNLLAVYYSRAGFTEAAAPWWQTLELIPSDAGATGQAMAVLRRVS